MKTTRSIRQLITLSICGMLSVVSLSACSQPAEESSTPAETEETEPEQVQPSWDDLYDQGIAFFQEEDYDKAIEAFTESIGIDPEHAPVYVSRGDAYVLKKVQDDTEADQNLTLAWNDYETASGIDETYAAAWLGMADVLIRRESFEEAYRLLGSVQGSAAEDPAILSKVQEIESGAYVDSSNQVRREDVFDQSGNLIGYSIKEYDFLGRRNGWRNYENYRGNGIELLETCVVTFDGYGLAVRNDYYNPDGSPRAYQTMEYDERGLEVRRNAYIEDKFMGYYLTYYDEEGKETGYDTYQADGTMVMYSRYDYDENGNLLQKNDYNPDGSLLRVIKPSDE